jgi:ribose/xylose/arabinose/galactoside ABC-type transport system permease subunit
MNMLAKKRSFTRIINYGNGIIISLIILFIFAIIAAIVVPNVFKAVNLTNILRVYSPAGIMAIGLALVLLTGEIDVSVGSIMSLAVMTASKLMDTSETLALISIVLVGGICGLINGIIIAKLKVPSLMVTIGSMSLFGGLASIVVNAQTKFISDIYVTFNAIAKGTVLGIPATFIICLIVALLCWTLTAKTRFGRGIYYTGANKRAAWMSGVNIDRVKITVFVISGILAAIAGMLITTQIGRAKSDVGSGYEVTAIAIAVLGGTSLEGGRGSILGVLCGMITMGILLNMLALSRMGSYFEMAMKGILVIAVVFVYELARRRSH